MRAAKWWYKHTNTNTTMTRGDRLVNVLHKTIQWVMTMGKTIG